MNEDYIPYEIYGAATEVCAMFRECLRVKDVYNHYETHGAGVSGTAALSRWVLDTNPDMRVKELWTLVQLTSKQQVARRKAYLNQLNEERRKLNAN